MPLTNYTITSPNGGTWTIQSTNSASVGRYHDLSFLQEGSATNLSKARPGVLSGAAPAATNVPNALQVSAAGSGLNITVQAGSAVVERGTLVGSYVVQSTVAATVTLGTADATNPRIDRIDLQVLDGALGDNGGTSLTRIIVTQGTASGTPALPAAPSNSIPLGQVLLPAGTTLLTSGMFTDTRKSAGLRGAARVLLPGDSLADPGFMVGERRMRFSATYGWLEDFWDAANVVWRGTQVLLLPQSAQVASGSLGNGVSVTISSTAIADPGWPFYVQAYGLVDFGSAVQATVLQVGLQLDSATFGTNRFAFDQEPAVAANAAFDLGSAVEGNCRTALGAQTGGTHTVYLVAKNAQGPSGAASITIYTNFYAFIIELIPALV